MKRLIAIVLVLGLAAAGPNHAVAQQLPADVLGQQGMVVAVSPDAADIGAATLKRGGNAVDAAIATAFAMAVTWPQAGNIGGGGFMMIHPGNGADPVCIDYRETAPAAATRTTFSLDSTRFGCRIVGVPGTVHGLETAHRVYGKLPWKSLVEPAVRLARDGFVIGNPLANSFNGILASEATKPFAEFQRVFGPTGREEWQPGDRLVQPDLAATLSRIAASGSKGFYTGKTAQLIVDEMQRGEGLITADDLAAYRAKIRKPIHTTFRGYDVYGPPPPSSGGITLALMLNTLENFELKKLGRWSPETAHLLAEAMRRAYLDRARHLGDADFVEIPPHLTTKAYAKRLAGEINRDKATPSVELAKDIPIAPGGNSTTHFSVLDASGMAVSNTYTLEFSYGSRVVVEGGGFLLNNEMGDFNWVPGHTDREGRIGTKANQIEPGKRMLSSQTPTIVAKEGRVLLVTGSPGGRTIINTVLCVVLNVLEFDMQLPEAVAASRMHHQWLPDQVRLEGQGTAPIDEIVKNLKTRGHAVREGVSVQGDAHSILVDLKTGTIHGVADGRRDGKASGY